MHRRSLAVAALTASLALLALIPAAASAWAPADQATIHPGVMTYTEGGQCTANFIYTGGEHLHRSGRTLRRHRCGHRDQRL